MDQESRSPFFFFFFNGYFLAHTNIFVERLSGERARERTDANRLIV